MHSIINELPASKIAKLTNPISPFINCHNFSKETEKTDNLIGSESVEKVNLKLLFQIVETGGNKLYVVFMR